MAFSQILNIMKTRFNILAGCLLLLISLLIVLRQPASQPASASIDAGTASPGKAASGETPEQLFSPRRAAGGSRNVEAGVDDPTSVHEPTEAARVAVLEKIQDAATTYDPAQLHIIRPYLKSGDPEIRSAAVEAMIVLGDASAGALLREAAAGIPAGDEATAMIKAADYVELPPADLSELTRKAKEIPLPGAPAKRKKIRDLQRSVPPGSEM